jgi:hypothetical protein
MALELNLEKSAKTLALCLEKAGIVTPPQLEVGFGLDVSGSFEDEHTSGVTNDLLTRLVPWGLAFDPDKKLDCFTFSDGEDNVADVGPADTTNYADFVKAKICEKVGGRVIAKVKGFNGGTDYSYVLEKMLGNFGWAGNTVKKAGFFGKLMGKKDEVVVGAKKRSLVIIATDGDNYDKQRTMDVLRASEARGDKVYFLFLGVSNQGSRFPFLESIGDQFSNTGFVSIPNLRKFVQMSDEELNQQLIGDELLAWFGSK